MWEIDVSIFQKTSFLQLERKFRSVPKAILFSWDTLYLHTVLKKLGKPHYELWGSYNQSLSRFLWHIQSIKEYVKLLFLYRQNR